MSERIDYERTDLSIRGTIMGFAVLSIVILVVGASVWMLKERLAEDPDRAGAGFPAAAVPSEAPLLQADPPADFRKLRRRADAILHSTAWVDKDRRIARIPIERAIDELAKSGWPEGAP